MAEPISAAIAAFSSMIAGAATAIGINATAAAVIGTAVTSAVISGSVNYALSALNQPKLPDQLAQLNAKRSTVADRTLLAGRTAVGGVLATDTMAHGRNNVLVGFVAILSGAGQNGVVEKIIYGDDEITFNSNGVAIGTYANKIWLTQRNGSWTQTAAIQQWSSPPSLDNNQPPDWTVNDKLLGCAHALVQINASDDKIKADGIKQPIFVFNANATPLIDPRTGAAASTQAQYDNPFVWAYSWARSTFQTPPSGLIMAGLALSASAVNATSFAYAANYADTNGFKISAEINLNPSNNWDNLKAMCQAGGGSVSTRNGQLYCNVAVAKSIVGVITDDDLIAMPKRKLPSTAYEKPNRILPRYRSEANKWEVVDGTPITDASFLSADGGKIRSITYEIPFAYGTDASIGKLAALSLVNAREPWEYSLSLKPQARYIGYVGDCIQLDITRLGWTGKKVLINSIASKTDLTSSVTALSETDSKYAWALGQTTTPPDFNENTRANNLIVPAPEIGSWTATNDVITSSGTQLPIIRVTGATDYDAATGIVVEYAPDEIGATYKTLGTFAPTQTEFEIGVVTPNQAYNVRISYINEYGVTGTPLELTPVTTDDLLTGGVTIGAKRDITINGMLNNTSWQDLAQLDFVNLPICIAEVTNLGLSATAFTGTSADLEFRIMLDGSQVALQASQNVFTGGSPSAIDLSDLFLDYTENELSAGNHTFILQARRTAGTGYVTAFSGIFEVTTTKKL